MTQFKVKYLGQVEYLPTWQAMQQFTAQREADTADELWLLQHPPVYTVGLNGKPEHFPAATQIPVIKIDRGGQITYHGPGQIVAYVLMDMKRRGFGVRELVSRMEYAVIDTLAGCNVVGSRQAGAPGVYVEGYKIAALGLRIKRGCSYHGLSLNVDMNLNPFYAINPCGFPGMQVTQTRDLGVQLSIAALSEQLVSALQRNLAS